MAVKPYFIDGPPTRLWVQDARDSLPDLLGVCDLVFADPPFNWGRDYKKEDGGWDDKLDDATYTQFTKEWLGNAVSYLSHRGSIFVNIPDEHVSLIDYLLRREHKLERVNWLIWHYRFGQCTKGRFIRSKVHCLHFAKDLKKRIWQPNEVLVPSDRASLYNDPRTETSTTPGERVPLDVWGFEPFWGRVQGNNKERQKLHDNQLPELYMARILRSSSLPESTVMDCFAGSGTLSTVARALGRRSEAIEFSPKLAASAWARIVQGPVRDVLAAG